MSDPEILDLFQDEPELLAVVDAISATLTARQRRLPRRLLLVAATAAAAVLVVSFAPWQFGGRSVQDRALAAIGDRRVVHLVATRREPARTVVDLRSGNERSGMLAVESWFDSQSGDLRGATRRDGELVADALVAEGAAVGGVDPLVAVFVRGYREALERGELEVVRRGRLGGEEVVWVRLTLPGARRDEIALDAETGLPRAFRLAVGSEAAGPAWRVQAIDSRPRTQSEFVPAELPVGPSGGDILSERAVTTSEANEFLDGHGRWPGSDVDGVPLKQVRAQELSRLFANGRRQDSRGVEFVYGDPRSDYLQIRQASAPEPAYGFTEGRLTLDFAPIPAPGQLSLTRLGPRARPLWLGQLSKDEVHMTIRSNRRDLVIDAARSLAALR
jgi:hypothetical protein